MSDISALESRITAALDRIRQGVESRSSPDAVASLQKALEAERAANAEIVESARALKDRQDAQVATLTQRVEAQQAQLAALDAQLQGLRASNAQMREMNTQLREAVTEGLAPDLVDAAVAAEMNALQTQRSADVVEIDAILAELAPLIEETSNAAD